MVPEVHVLGGVEPKPVDVPIEIVPGDLQNLLPDGGVVEVQLRHAPVEVALIVDVGAGQGGEGPARGRFLALGIIGIEIVIGIVLDILPVGLGEGAEPGVRPGGVVDDHIEDQLHAPLMAEGDELVQIRLGAEVRVDLVVVRHVIFMIGRGLEDGGEPDALDAQGLAGVGVPVVQVVEPVYDAPEVPDAVPVGVGEGAHEDLVEHPGVVRHGVVGLQQRIVDHPLLRRRGGGFGGGLGGGRGRFGGLLLAGEAGCQQQRGQQQGKYTFDHGYTPPGWQFIYNGIPI